MQTLTDSQEAVIRDLILVANGNPGIVEQALIDVSREHGKAHLNMVVKRIEELLTQSEGTGEDPIVAHPDAEKV